MKDLYPLMGKSLVMECVCHSITRPTKIVKASLKCKLPSNNKQTSNFERTEIDNDIDELISSLL